MKKLLYLLLPIAISCSKENDSTNQVASQFAFEQVEGKTLTSISSKSNIGSNSNIGFDLGDIKKTKQFYFILSNTGEAPIFDIELKSSNP
ncbi:MAG: hypothetical protein AB3N10_04285, partial [Allomuricauda sp.]